MRFEMNAICFPSGVNRGEFSVLSPPINSLGGVDPLAGTVQIFGFLRPVSNAVAVCDQVRAVDKRRLARTSGQISPTDLKNIEEGLRRVLEL